MDMGRFRLGILPLGRLCASVPLPAVYGLMVAGVVLLLLFNNIDSPAWVRPLRGLWELYQYASGLISNGLSYLRLFALGLAGGLLAASFNNIALMFITENGVVNPLSWKIIFTVLLVVASHALVLGLSVIGAFAHPLRLTFVEFYGAVQFKGGGKPFRPFTITNGKP